MTLDAEYLNHMQSFCDAGPIGIHNRQAPLRAQYEKTPEAAWVIDHACTTGAAITPSHPIHSHVICGQGIPVDIPVCVHRAVGGESDFPNPGEILAASLAACLDMTIRMIANLMEIKLTRLEVKVDFCADVRGTLMMGKNVPVGFQTAQIKVGLKAETDLAEAQLNTLLDAAERSCVVLQTLRNPPLVEIERKFD